MTDSQIKYWTLMEDQRHNYAMEAYNQAQMSARQRELDIKQKEADVKEAEAYLKGKELMLDVARYPQEYELRRQQAQIAVISGAARTVQSTSSAWESFMSGIGKMLKLMV